MFDQFFELEALKLSSGTLLPYPKSETRHCQSHYVTLINTNVYELHSRMMTVILTRRYTTTAGFGMPRDVKYSTSPLTRRLYMRLGGKYLFGCWLALWRDAFELAASISHSHSHTHV